MDFENSADIHTDKRPSIQNISKLENLEPGTEVSDSDIAALDFRDLVLEDTEQAATESEPKEPEADESEDAEPGAAEPDETPARKMLKRDANRASLTRKEEAARTEEDFIEIKRWWKRMDANRMRKERYWEQLMSSDMFDWDLDEGTPCYYEDTLGIIFSCICEMHELTEHPDIYRLIPQATDKQKTAFFWRIIAGWSTVKIAACYEITDRNVRKLIDTMLENLRIELYAIIYARKDAKQFVSYREDIFLDNFKHYKPVKKKKRGRPKKEKDESANAPDITTEKRKRGRPRKNLVGADAPKEKRKRGRPRKQSESPMQSENSVDNSNGN